MSKYVKNLVTGQLASKLEGVQEALLANVIGLDANQSVVLRRELRGKDISLLVVKNSLAKRATEGTPLAPAFESAEGSLAVLWGSEDFISLAKEVERLDKSREYAAFQTRGGVMDGEALTPQRITEISKWPNRQEQLSILSGQLLAPGGKLAAQLEAPGGALASQVEKLSDAEASEEETETDSQG